MEPDHPVGVGQEPEEVAVEGAASAEGENPAPPAPPPTRAQAPGEAVFVPTAAPRLPTSWAHPATA